MSEIEKNKFTEFVPPPEYSLLDIQNLEIKLRSFGMGDKIHKEMGDIGTIVTLFEIAKLKGGWTQELKDNLMDIIIKIKSRIIDLEGERAKKLGL